MTTTILVVDDNSLVRRTLDRMLRREDRVVLLAADAAEALEVLERVAVDLVITDVCMPDGNGISLLRSIRVMHPKLPAIACTGLSAHDVEAAGFDAVVLKPATIEELENAIGKVLRG